MAITQLLFSPWILLAIPVLYWVLPYLRNNAIRSVPGPRLAAFSNLWLLWNSRKARRSLAVDAAHKRYGTLVRIQPRHVSVADDAAIPIIYGHGNGFTKPDFYDAFVSIHRGLFNVRDRAAHTRKRKIVSNTFSAKSVTQFEPYIHGNLDLFVKQWDDMSIKAKNDPTGYFQMDALHWYNYLAFDVIGDLAFGAPFGMLAKGADVAEVRETPTSKPKFAPAIEVLNRRGEVSAAIGCLPAMKPYAKHLPDPFFSKGVRAVENLAGIAVARVRGRLDAQADGHIDRKDLLARLMEGKDDHGQPLGREELTAEALTQLIAGSDTTSNTSCAVLYHVLANPRVIPLLQQELDAAIPAGVDVPSFDMVRDLPYLDATIKEAMRIHSTSSMGLPREVPPGPGVTLHGIHFPPTSILSVPAYTIHHSTAIWGPDAAAFKPERFLRGNLSERQKNAFIPFSHGPRACVGRNVAEMELALIAATVFRRYEFELRQTGLKTREGFLRKPEGLLVGVRLRDGITPLT